MIEIKNLYKRYHNHHDSQWVLRDINLTIPTGVSVGLIGANGAGKSTLLRLIAGMDTPERGEVIRHSRVSWPIGLSGGMQGSMTGRQNVKFVARAQGKKHDIDEIVQFVEDFAEIGEAFNEPVKTYSSGMRSRLSFGLSFAFDFDVYISDEATAVGDRSFKNKAKSLFNKYVGSKSIIMVSHSEGIIKELCDAGIYLKDGKAIWYPSINDALEQYHIDSPVRKSAPEPLNLKSQSYISIKKDISICKDNIASLKYVLDLLDGNSDNELIKVIIKRKIRAIRNERAQLQRILDTDDEEVLKKNKSELKRIKSARILLQEVLSSRVDEKSIISGYEDIDSVLCRKISSLQARLEEASNS